MISEAGGISSPKFVSKMPFPNRRTTGTKAGGEAQAKAGGEAQAKADGKAQAKAGGEAQAKKASGPPQRCWRW